VQARFQQGAVSRTVSVLEYAAPSSWFSLTSITIIILGILLEFLLVNR